jgi:hypothetical protein
MNKELQLGTIQYKWGQLDSTAKITGEDLFENYLDQGADSLVYEKGEFVYKIDKNIQYSMEEIEEAIKEKLFLTSLVQDFEPLTYIGYLKVKGFDAYHIVYRQKKLRKALQSEWQNLILKLHNDGWHPYQFNADKKGVSLYDIGIHNIGVDENGTPRILDCAIYSRELEIQKMARN